MWLAYYHFFSYLLGDCLKNVDKDKQGFLLGRSPWLMANFSKLWRFFLHWSRAVCFFPLTLQPGGVVLLSSDDMTAAKASEKC